MKARTKRQIVRQFIQIGLNIDHSTGLYDPFVVPLQDILFSLSLALLMLGLTLIRLGITLWQLVIAVFVLTYSGLMKLIRLVTPQVQAK